MGNQPVTPRSRKAVGAIAKYRPSAPAPPSHIYGYGIVCILRHRVTHEPIPIENVHVSVNIVHSLAEVTVSQVYHNTSTSPLECTFEFGIGDNAVLSSLSVAVDDKIFRAVVQEKEEAFAAYDDAISSGGGAYLLESTDKANKYKMNVGNLPASKRAEVFFSLVVPLVASHEGWLFSIPKTIFPQGSTYLTSIEGRVDMGEEVTAIELLSQHQIQTDCTGFKSTQSEASHGISSEINFCIKLKSRQAAKETTQASTNELTKPTLVIEHHLEHPTLFAAMLDFRPVFSSTASELASDYEFVVLADCGGAMYGPKMAQQTDALRLLVHSLPSGCKFNLISVNDNYTSQWPTSVVLDEENLTKALWAIDHLGAQAGGETRLRAALNSIYRRRDPHRSLCVFLLTAMDYSPEARDLAKIVSTNASRNSRLFAIGFGDEVDTELLDSLAFSGRGKAHFVKEDGFVDGVLFQQLVTAFAPRVRDIKVQWNLDESAKAEFVAQAPHNVPITASGSSTVVYGLFEVPVPDDVVIPPPEDPITAKRRLEQEDPTKKGAAAASKSSKPPATLPISSEATVDTIGTAVKASGASGTSSTNLAKKPKTSKPKEKTENKLENAPGTTGSDAAAATSSSPTTPSKKAPKKKEKKEGPLMPELPKSALFLGLKLPITDVTITGVGPDDAPLKWTIPVSEASFRGMNRMIRCRGAHLVCQDLASPDHSSTRSEQEAKSRIIDLSTRFQVASKYTSFIAVEEREGEAAEAPMKKVDLKGVEDEQQDTPTTPQPHNCHHRIYHRCHICNPVRYRSVFQRRLGNPPPPPPPAVHYAPRSSLAVTSSPSGQSFSHTFASDKARKKMSKEKGDSIAGERGPSSVNLASANPHLGFVPRNMPDDDGYDGFDYERQQAHDIIAQAPAQYRLHAPAPQAAGGAAPHPQPSETTTEALERKDLHQNAEPESDEDEKQEPPAAPPAPPQPHTHIAPTPVSGSGRNVPRHSERSAPKLKKSTAKPSNSAFDDDTMIPNRASLSDLRSTVPTAPSSVPAKHYISMQPPSDWKFTDAVLSMEASQTHSTTVSRLRTIVRSQHADGSWDLDTVCKLLKLDRASIEAANPLSTHDDAKPKKKKARKGSVTHKDSAVHPETDATHPSEPPTSVPAPSETAGPEKPATTPQDLWATAILFAHLKRAYDAERDFWTFVALKVSALFAAAIADEAARKSVFKKAKKYLESLPVTPTTSTTTVSVSP